MPTVENKDTRTKILAITGTLFAWFPIGFTIVTSVIGTISDRTLRFDYLLPAELSPVALIGAILLLWAARRAGSRKKLIGWGLASAAIFLIGGQAIAMVTGLASGEVEPTGMPLVLVVSSLVLYSLTLIEIAIAGLFLLRDLYS